VTCIWAAWHGAQHLRAHALAVRPAGVLGATERYVRGHRLQTRHDRAVGQGVEPAPRLLGHLDQHARLREAHRVRLLHPSARLLGSKLSGSSRGVVMARNAERKAANRPVWWTEDKYWPI
jgi:hypothetical protein